MRPRLQTLLDESERQPQLAGTLGQRILERHMELEKRINALTRYERRNLPHMSDSEWDPEMYHNLQDLAMTMETWEAEKERAWDDYDQNVSTPTPRNRGFFTWKRRLIIDWRRFSDTQWPAQYPASTNLTHLIDIQPQVDPWKPLFSE